MASVSVVIPTFDSRGLVAATVAAVFAQTRPPAEVIVVDDGSPEDVATVLRGFPVRHHRIANVGPGRARQAGVELARSDWVAFCDSDDLWRPTYLERFLAQAGPDSRYGFANWVHVIGDAWTDARRFDAAPAGFFADAAAPFYARLLGFTPAWPSGTLIRRDFFHALGGIDPRFSRFATEDFEFTLRCNEHPHAMVLHEALVGIRRHDGNYSAGAARAAISDVAIMAFAARHHATGRALGAAMDAAIVARRIVAFNAAFAEGDLATMRAVAREIPWRSLSWKGRVKWGLAQGRLVPGGLLRRGGAPAGRFARLPPTPD